MSYPKLTPKHGEVYRRVRALKHAGTNVCDAIDHNAQDSYGCSNPQCWKHARKRPMATKKTATTKRTAMPPVMPAAMAAAVEAEAPEMYAVLKVALYDLEQAMAKIPGWRPRCLTRLKAVVEKIERT